MPSKVRTVCTSACVLALVFALVYLLSLLFENQTQNAADEPMDTIAYQPPAQRDAKFYPIQRNSIETAIKYNRKPSPRAAHAQVRQTAGCKSKLCFEYLSKDDRERFHQCLDKVKSYNVSKMENGTCRFMDGKKRGTTALASFPGSGNTWVRGLLETATGVCTGGFCCDISLRARGFSGEYIQSGSVLAVKTHRPVPYWRGKPKPSSLKGKNEASYTAAIVLVRNPFDALVSEWNRIVSNGFQMMTVTMNSHSGQADTKWFGNNTKWGEFVQQKLSHWESMVTKWVVDGWKHHPILVVKYEDLKKDVYSEVKRMLEFLSYPCNEEELRTRLESSFGTFHRKHLNTFDPFTPHQRQQVVTVLTRTAKLAKQHRLTILKLEEYLPA